MYTLQFDGMLRSFSPSERYHHEGLLGYGWLILHRGIEVARGFGVFIRNGATGSNIAEYLALIEGLEALADLHLDGESIQIHGDAKCVIDQMSGCAAISSTLTRSLYRRATRLARRFSNLTWVWIPRRENKPADLLSRRGLRYLRYSPMQKSIRHTQTQHSSSFISLVDLRIYAQKEATS